MSECWRAGLSHDRHGIERRDAGTRLFLRQAVAPLVAAGRDPVWWYSDHALEWLTVRTRMVGESQKERKIKHPTKNCLWYHQSEKRTTPKTTTIRYSSSLNESTDEPPLH